MAEELEELLFADGAAQILQVVYLTIVLLLALVTNSLVMSVVYRESNLQTPGNLLLVALSFIHIVGALNSIPITVLVLGMGGYKFGQVYCTVQGLVGNFTIISSLCLLGAVCGSRLLMVTRPTEYLTKFTDDVAKLVGGACFLPGGVAAVLPLVEGTDFKFNPGMLVCWGYSKSANVIFLASFLWCILSTTVSHYLSYREAKRLAAIKASFGAAVYVWETLKRTAFMAGAFWITWLPGLVINIIIAEKDAATMSDYAFQRIFILLNLLTTFMNPLMYAFTHQFIRNAVRRQFYRMHLTMNEVMDDLKKWRYRKRRSLPVGERSNRRFEEVGVRGVLYRFKNEAIDYLKKWR
ncbi:trace amine-associated receptor 9-like [Branchiostoma floridae]|uniref:Trace amine-associated receptor 9-like n=1 Tax=Branchiostoma floridae TaxID=7739 RepID=A0A9J7LA18_BRAFL|nr:trace amine-associated receptor 9-like [Branchiostoma floridae]